MACPAQGASFSLHLLLLSVPATLKALDQLGTQAVGETQVRGAQESLLGLRKAQAWAILPGGTTRNPLQTLWHLLGTVFLSGSFGAWSDMPQGTMCWIKLNLSSKDGPLSIQCRADRPYLGPSVSADRVTLSSSWEMDMGVIYLIHDHVNKVYRQNSGSFRNYPLNLLS